MKQYTMKKYGDITAKLYKNGLLELTAPIQDHTLTQTFKGITLVRALNVFKAFVDFRKSY